MTSVQRPPVGRFLVLLVAAALASCAVTSPTLDSHRLAASFEAFGEPLSSPDAHAARLVTAHLEMCRGQDPSACLDHTDAIEDLGDAALAPLAEALSDPDANVRVVAAVTLGRLGDPRAVPALLRRLDDPQPDVGVAVAAAVGSLGSPEAVPRLIQAAIGHQHAPDLAVRTEAAVQALQLGSTAGVEFLLTVLAENTLAEADPPPPFKDWERRERWAWEKGRAGWALARRLGASALHVPGDPLPADSNAPIPDQERAARALRNWWLEHGREETVRHDWTTPQVYDLVRRAFELPGTESDPALRAIHDELFRIAAAAYPNRL